MLASRCHFDRSWQATVNDRDHESRTAAVSSTVEPGL